MVDADGEAFLQPFAEVRCLGRTSDEDDAIDRGARHALFFEHAQADVDGLVDQRGRGGEQFLAGQGDVGAVDLRPVGGLDHGRDVKGGRGRAGEGHLGRLREVFEDFHARTGLLFAVGADEPVGGAGVLRMDFREDDLLYEGPVDVRAAEEVIPAVVDDRHGAVLGLDEGRVEGASAEIEDEPVGLLARGLEAVG